MKGQLLNVNRNSLNKGKSTEWLNIIFVVTYLNFDQLYPRTARALGPIFVHTTQHILQKSCTYKIFFFICNTSKLSAFHNLKILYQLVARVLEKPCRDTFAFILCFYYQHGHLDDSMFAHNLHDREGNRLQPPLSTMEHLALVRHGMNRSWKWWMQGWNKWRDE